MSTIAMLSLSHCRSGTRLGLYLHFWLLSVIFLLPLAAFAQTVASPVTVTIAAPVSAQACGTTTVQWTISYTDPTANITAASLAVDSTWVGIWVSNVGVAGGASTSSSAVASGAVRATTSSAVVAATSSITVTSAAAATVVPRARHVFEPRQGVVTPITKNVTSGAHQLMPVTGGTSVVWTPIAVPPNQYYVMYMRSLPGHAGGLDLAVQTAPFFVSAGLNLGCLVVPTTTSASRTTSSTYVTTSAHHTSSGTPIAAEASAKTSNGGAIAGGVIGGLAALVLLLLLLLCIRKKRRGQRQHQVAGLSRSFLPTIGSGLPNNSSGTTSLEKDVTAPSSIASRYGGVLAAIGISTRNPATPADNAGTRRKLHRAQDSEAYLDNAYTFSPDTTLEGSGGARGSYGESNETAGGGARAAAGVDVAKRSNDHITQKSSSVTTSAQSATTLPHDAVAPRRRTSQRSSRSASGGKQSHRIEERKSDTLPDGAAAPNIVAGGQGISPSSSNNTDTTSPLARTPSQRASKPTRKKAPRLPDALVISSGAATAGSPPSAYYTPTYGALGNHSDTSLDTTCSTSPRGATFGQGIPSTPQQPFGRKGSQDPMWTGKRLSSGTNGGGPFEKFAGAKEGPVHLLMPDMPAELV